MNRRAWFATFGTIACAAVVVGAQSPSSQSNKDVKITGCVERATSSETTTGTSGTTGSAATKFVLSSASTTPSGTTGTSGSSAASASASKYRLDTDDSKVSAHVGHKVEITGTVEEQPAATTGTPATTQTAGNEPKLKVDSVRMISPTCP